MQRVFKTWTSKNFKKIKNPDVYQDFLFSYTEAHSYTIYRYKKLFSILTNLFFFFIVVRSVHVGQRREKGLCMALPSVKELEDRLRSQSGRFFATVTGDVWVPILIGQPDGEHELPWLLEYKWPTTEDDLVLRMMGRNVPEWIMNDIHPGENKNLAKLKVNPREHRQVTVEISCGYNYYARTVGTSGSKVIIVLRRS